MQKFLGVKGSLWGILRRNNASVLIFSIACTKHFFKVLFCFFTRIIFLCPRGAGDGCDSDGEFFCCGFFVYIYFYSKQLINIILFCQRSGLFSFKRVIFPMDNSKQGFQVAQFCF